MLPRPPKAAVDLLAEGTMSLREAAEFIGTSRRTLYRLMDTDRVLPWVKVRGGRKIPRVALRLYLLKQLQCGDALD